jgi:rhodanese-related sulfurtransferase
LIALLLLSIYVLARYWRRHRFTALVRRSHVSPEELHTLLGGSPTPLVLDVRSALSRQLDPRAIPGALHVPPDEIAGLLRALGSPPAVIVYCNCPNDAAAGYIARKLMDAGFEGVRALQGGLDGWNAAGYPLSVLDAGKASAERQLAPA